MKRAPVKKIERICQRCGLKFSVYPSTIKHNGAKFCSQSCAGKQRMLRNFPTRAVDNVTDFLTED